MQMDIVVMIERWWAETGTSSASMPAIKLAPEMQFYVMLVFNNKAGKLLPTKGMSLLLWPSTDDRASWTYTKTLAGLQ